MLSASKSGSASGASGYNLTRSLRFRSSASAYLNRTFTTPTSSTIYTWSSWVKRGTLSTTQYLFGASTTTNFGFNSSNNLIVTLNGTTAATTTAVYRDPSSWYHVVYVQNGSAQTIYVNNISVATGTTANTVFNTAIAHQLAAANTTNYFDGYLAETNFIDGQALTPSSFGSTNALTGVWQPAAYTGTYGTNGFYLPFTDNSALTTSSNVGLGKDFSGNGNYWTTNNISITAGVTYDSMTDVPTLTSATAANFAVLNPLNPSRSTLTNGNLTASGATDTPTIIPTSGTYYFEIDGVSKSWTPPAAFPAAAGNYNFGQRPFTNTPTGTLLNTYNLPTSTIVKGNTVMDATLYTGTGASLSVTNAASFKPDLVWLKSRSAATDNKLTDSVRGVTQALASNSTNAETTDVQGLTAFNTNGFTVGTNTDYNNLAGSYVGWQWQAGQGSSSSNTNGTITSTVSVNASAGFSVVTYTGTGANATVGHGLGVAPQLIIVKPRSATITTDAWNVYHVSTGNTNFLVLNATDASAAASNRWNNTSPTSSVFSIGTVPSSVAVGYVAYCWTPIAGFSAFGSYTGNGSSDGTFVYTGFRPKFVLFKRTDTTGDWVIEDTTRSAFNQMDARLFPYLADAEDSNGNGNIDYLSNGFKLRNSAASMNASGGTYIYMAFAENPFKNSLAR